MEYAIGYRDGTVVCHSSLPYLGYSFPTLKDMEQAGYILFLGGKRVKFPTAGQLKEAQQNG